MMVVRFDPAGALSRDNRAKQAHGGDFVQGTMAHRRSGWPQCCMQ